MPEEHDIELQAFAISCPEAQWNSLIRQFSVEEQHEGSFLIGEFPELQFPIVAPHNRALRDTYGILRHKALKRFERKLWQKYRQGDEFRNDDDYEELWGKVYETATQASQAEQAGYIGVEIYYWVILQLLREQRGEKLDGVYQGADTRLGQLAHQRGFALDDDDEILLR